MTMTHDGIQIIHLIPQLEAMAIQRNCHYLTTKINEIKAFHFKNDHRHLVIHTPELSLTAYDCGDLFLLNRRVRNTEIETALTHIKNATRPTEHYPAITVTVGFPFFGDHHRHYILHAIISNGEIVRIKAKEALANNIGTHRGVEYETRYFVPVVVGDTVKLFGEQRSYGDGLFSDQPVEIAGARLSLVICEEMYIGTETLDGRRHEIAQLKETFLTDYLTEMNELSRDRSYITNDADYCQFMHALDNAIDATSNDPSATQTFATLICNAIGLVPGENVIKALNEKINALNGVISATNHKWAPIIQSGLTHNPIYRQLLRSDCVLIPNGSPSSTGKIDRRIDILSAIATQFMNDHSPSHKKQIFYANNLGIPFGSIHFDGAVIRTKIDSKSVHTQLLSAYRAGMIGDDTPYPPHWATKAGQRAIAAVINGTPYYSGKIRRNIQFGWETVHIYPKFLQHVDYAYGNLCKHITQGTYQGIFIAASGGFDSAHTLVVRAKAIECRLRILLKTQPSDDFSPNFIEATSTLNRELKLDSRPINHDHLTRLFHVAPRLARFNNHNLSTVHDLLMAISDCTAFSDAEKTNLLSKSIIFHTVKSAYIRSANNSHHTEIAARNLAGELGIDFEVHDIEPVVQTILLLEKGIDLSRCNPAHRVQLLGIYSQLLAVREPSEDAKFLDLMTQFKVTCNIAGIPVPTPFSLHTWFTSKTGVEIENIQARLRADMNWQIASEHGLMPTSNPNADESKQGYTTCAGDKDSGKESSTADLRKIEILAELAYLSKASFEDCTLFYGKIDPIPSLAGIFEQPPSAELRPKGSENGVDTIQQTDEDSYGMSYYELSKIGDRLFQISDDGYHFVHIDSVYQDLKKSPLFFGHSAWSVYSKIDKVYRQWFFAAFKRRSSPWQMTNSDVAVDHHSNNRTEFAGFAEAVRHERAQLLLTILYEQNRLPSSLQNRPLADLKTDLLLNPSLQTVLHEIISHPVAIEPLVNQRAPGATSVGEPHSIPIIGKPLRIKNRDFSGNVNKAKRAIGDAVAAGHRIIVIPEIIGSDMGDNIRRVHQWQIDALLDTLQRFISAIPADIAVIVGHPTTVKNHRSHRFNIHPGTDRSFRYIDAATILYTDPTQRTIRYCTQLDVNSNLPGLCYDSRTKTPFLLPQDPVELLGNRYFVAIGWSIPQSTGTPIIHLGSLAAQDQLTIVKKFETFAISVNAIGCPSGIRVFNGQIITPETDLTALQQHLHSAQFKLDHDAQWLDDYIPPHAKVTVHLNGPEALYTIAVLKRRIDLFYLKNNADFAALFAQHVDVVGTYSATQDTLTPVKDAANEILGFPLPHATLDHPRNFYDISGVCDGNAERWHRIQSIFGWLLSARDGGDGQLLLSNAAQNEWCCSPGNNYGGRLHSGGLSVTTGRTLADMATAINTPIASELLNKKRSEMVDYASGLTLGMVDDIWQYIVDHQFEMGAILKSNGLSISQTQLNAFITLWEKNSWDRHGQPNSPECTHDQQGYFREPLCSQWLRRSTLAADRLTVY